MEQRGTAPHKESVVLLAYSEAKKKHYVIAKPAHSFKAQLIRVDPESGVLKWDQAVGRDTFDNEAEALAYLQDQGRVEVLAHGKAVLGYTVLGPVALLLLAEAVRVSGVLPGGHEIKTVVQSKWHRINLQQPELDPISQAAAKAELDRGIDKTTNFPVDGAHFYCETLDISRPFPSERPAHQPSWPFVWNKALSAPFRAAGLDGPATVCPALLQGMAESRELEDFDGCRFSYCLVSRRCRLHVGPRYKARGLNEAADPGNEIECDQLVWKHSSAAGKPLAWSRYTWRRGSVPMWWTVNIRNGGMGEAEIKIRSTNTFRGSRRYVRRLQRRYMPNPHLEPDAEQEAAAAAAAAAPAGSTDASLQVPVVFFSLLRKGTPDRDRSEAKLAEAFDFLAGQLRSVHRLPVSYVALDWHQMDKELGSEALVEAFWSQLSALLPPQSFALGTLVKVGPDHTDNDGLDMDAAAASSAAAAASNGAAAAAAAAVAAGQQGYSSAGRGWVARWFKQQRGVTRYNCADSLDRTNVGSFFGAVQVFVEQCRELDIAIAATSASAASMARQALLRRQAAAAAAAATAAGSAGGAAAAAAGAAGRPPLAAAAAAGALTQDKRSGSASSASGSSGFLSSLGKAVMGDLRISPRSPRGGQGSSGGPSSGSSPRGGATGDFGRDLSRELCVHSSPNISLMQQQQQQQQQLSQLRAGAGAPQQQQQQQEPPLPPGWEAKYDAVNKRVFYVDHNTKTTTWTRPACAPPAAAAASNGDSAAADLASSKGSSNGHAPVSSSSEQQLAALAAGGSSSRGSASPHHKRPGSLSRKSLTAEDGASGSDSDSGADKERYEPLTPWCMFSPRHARVRHFARVINAPALSAIAELFLMNGDMCAWLYTGSPAMHSEKITLFEPESSRLKKAGAGAYSNSFIAIRRRYNNVLMDEERKMQAEMFLGMKARLYFPTLHLAYREPEGGVPDDWPESDDDEPTASGEAASDPLGLLTWPLESSKTQRSSIASSAAAGLAGAAAALVGLGGSGGAAGAGGTGLSLMSGSGRIDRERLSSGSSFSESPDLLCERPPSHTRSFSSEKILQEFRELQRAGQAAAAAHSQGQGQLLGQASPGRPPLMPQAPASSSPSSFTKPTPAAAAATGAAAASLGAKSMADFDQELSDRAPPAANVLKPFDDPLGLL
uniref:WW domain-containing protein n=1 Tax=Tetradesmus obliquus TaxID=3088 RepID=A0A383VGT2_TETOB|eukprot:jgi/Sobl393_1/2373/SZX64755.1